MSFRRCLPLLAVIAAITATADAHAAKEEGTQPRETSSEDARRPVALTINPLAFVIERYGANFEYSFLPHHVVVASGYVQTVPVEMVRPFMPANVQIRDGATSPSLGGEIGYRLYSGRTGANGLFIGGSFVAMPLAYPRLTSATMGRATVELERMYGFGGAVDVGAQVITSFGLTLGGGLGATFLSYEEVKDSSRLPIAMPSVLPRMLLQTGYAF
jgi:hypothetical protein